MKRGRDDQAQSAGAAKRVGRCGGAVTTRQAARVVGFPPALPAKGAHLQPAALAYGACHYVMNEAEMSFLIAATKGRAAARRRQN